MARRFGSATTANADSTLRIFLYVHMPVKGYVDAGLARSAESTEDGGWSYTFIKVRASVR